MIIVIISPTYNEKENVARLIPLLEEEVFPTIKHHDIKLLIVDDNTPWTKVVERFRRHGTELLLDSLLDLRASCSARAHEA